MCSGSVTWPSIGHSVGRQHTLWILLLVVLFWRQKAVRATQTTSHPPSIIGQAARSLLFLLSFSRAPEPGLWPVDECYILAVSTGVSWGLACGGSAVSGPVCQLLVPLPPTHQRRLQPVAQAYGVPSCDWLRSRAWKWKDRPQNRHIHNHANVKGLFKTFKCSGVVFLNRPWKLWQMVYYFAQYFISGTFSCCFLTSEYWPCNFFFFGKNPSHLSDW